MLHIRPYHPEDESSVIALWHECGLVVPQNDPKRDITRKLAVNPEYFLVAEQEGLVVGTCMAGYEGHRGWINYLAVAPGEQRKGIASSLMAHAEKLLFDAGCPKINLQVRATNRQAVDFYERIGFMKDEVLSFGKRLHFDTGSK